MNPFPLDDKYGDQSSFDSRFDLAASYVTTRRSLGLDKAATALPAHSGESATHTSGK